MNGGTGAVNIKSSNTQDQGSKESKPGDVNFVGNGDAVEIMNAQKRTADDASLSNHGADKGKRPARAVASSAQPMDIEPTNQVVGQKRTARPRRRAPPRRLVVNTPKRDIWRKLSQLDAGLSMAQWISLDKAAYKDLRDGLRYLYGRKPKAENRKSQAQVNNMEVDVGADEDWSTESEWSTSDTESVSSVDSLRSDDTLHDYPYNFSTLQSSKPMKAQIVINGEPIEATFDTGASVSVISRPLAEKLGLQPNGDCLPLSSLGQTSAGVGKVTTHVPIRVAGKYRPEHMCIFDTHRPICLLGMTWFRAHGIRIDHTDASIVIPIKNGHGSVVLQCNEGAEGQDDLLASEENGVVFAANITGGEGEPVDIVDLNDGQAEVFMTSVADKSHCAVEEEPDPGASKLLEFYKEELLGNGSVEGDDVSIPAEITNLLDQFEHCFVEHSGLGRVKGYEHHIPLQDSTPVRSKPYRLTWEEEDHLRKELATMTDLGLIRPSKGIWTSPIFFVRKKTGELRLVIDYRQLNAKTVKDAYPLPHLDDLLGSMAGAQVFSTLDAASGYWQIPLAQEAIELSGFVTKYGTFEFTVMPFGLTSAPVCFQRTMTSILGPFIGKFVFVFIDDIIIFSSSVEEHVEHLRQVLQVCDQAGLRLKRAKCEFARTYVEYLGHIVSNEGLLPSPNNVVKIRKMQAPRNVDQVRSFIGMVNYYRRHIPECAQLLHPISQLMRRKGRFYWGPDQEAAFTHIKILLTGPPILSYPDREQVPILTTDASGEALGAILSQSPDGSDNEETVIAYESRVLRGPELAYAAVHQEALAIVWAVHKFRHFLAGRRFVLRTDNSALTYILSNSKPSPKLQRWAAALLEYNFIIQHHPGKKNPADALSRLPFA